MEAFMTLWNYLQTRIEEREDGLVALEYVILGAIVVALIGAGMTLFATDVKNAFAALL